MVGREGKGTEPPEERSYWGMAARECDSCRTTPALLFCRTHSAFLCGPCDTCFHASTTIVAPHECVPMCEVCEQAPATFTCKADAATLCVTCDADIHSANPLAQRHDRAHILPLFHSPTRGANSDVDPNVAAVDFFLKLTDDYEVEETERASKRKIKGDGLDNNEYHLSAVDPFLELDHQYVCSSMTEAENPKFHHAVGVVDAVQDRSVRPQPPPVRHDLDDFTNLNQTAYSNYVSPLSHSVSSEVGKVSEGSTAMDMTPHSQEQYWSTEKQTAIERVGRGMDREARLMRYREKRKNRKFQKTIRYASRKAYAETRPRLKGRFVKRKELGGYADAGVADSIYSSSAAAVAALMVDGEYGVVPSF